MSRKSSQKRTTLAAALLTAVLAGASLAAPLPAAAATQTLSVDLGATTGAVQHGANGSLYGLSDDGVPGDNLLAPLKLTTVTQGAPGGTQHPNGDPLKISNSFVRNGGGAIVIYLQDIYSAWPYQNNGIADYLPKVQTMVKAAVANPNHAHFQYIPLNEPDWIWYNLGATDTATYQAGRDKFFSDWKTLYQAIKAIDPTGKVVGPNEAYYDSRFMGDFLPWAKANNVLPDVASWHELSPSSLSGFDAHVAAYRALETANGISARPIDITEYGNRRDLSVPGQLTQWISMFERNKAYADQAYWDIAGNLDGNAVQTNIPNGSWWLFHWYAGMTGQTVAVTPPQTDVIDTLQGFASLDTAKQQAQVVVGGSATDTNVVLKNIPTATFGSNVEVTVSADDWSGYEGASNPPLTLSRAAYTVSNGTVTVPLTGLNSMSAYRITVTPNRGGTATAPVVPWTASYEAENAAITDATVVTQGNVNNANGYAASGGKDVGFISNADSKVDFTVTVPSAGTYNLGIFYGNQNGAPSQQFLRIDGGAARYVNYPSTLNWQYRAVQTVPVALSAGTHTLTLAVSDPTLGTASGQVTLDKIDLTAAQATPETVYEATLADTSGAASYSYSSVGETGTGAVTLSSGGATIFDAYAPADGYYALKTDYTSTGGTTNLSLNGTVIGTLPSTNGAATVAGNRIYLAAGINRISYAPNGTTQTTLRSLKVDGAGDTTGVTTYQAENATLAGTAVVASNSWASGGKYVGSIGNGAANTLTFANVTAANSGRYTVVVHYANNDRQGTGNYNTNVESRFANLTVNGAAQTVAFRNTYSWSDFDGLPVAVNLNAGSNSLVISNPTGYAPDVDYITVAPVNG